MMPSPSAQHTLATGLPELLAPAGSPESFRAAVAAGADAIYLSGKRFGARKFAANFSDAEIEESIRYAHAWGIRVYVTVNTLIHDRELKGALEYLSWLYSIGVDAVLMQDTGLLALARECLPGLPLHASTQMTIHNTPGVRWAAQQGFSRVVLARELSLPEVERIAQDTRDTGIGLEVFIHGALCYSYSGQCLFSSFLGGRSGNRGMCAQPCRKPYALVTGETDAEGKPVHLKEVPLKDRYLLSPKDLCTYRHLPELVRSPVASLKIEGRMKSPEYVAIVTSIYRRALDAIAAGTWHPSDEEYRNLLLAFNRGFTAGYLFSERYGKLMGRDAPDNRGFLIGRIEHYQPKTRVARIRSCEPVVPGTGDGILITDTAHPEQEVGFSLNTEPVQTEAGFSLPLPAPVPKGAEVYITASRSLAATARRIVVKPLPELRRPVPVDLTVTISPEGQVEFKGTVTRPDGVSIPVSYNPEERMVPAQTQPLSAEQLGQQFRKTGDTPFAIHTLSLRYAGGFFAPASLINSMRRAFLNEAGERLQASWLPDPDDVRIGLRKIREALLHSAAGPDAPVPALGERSAPLRLIVYTDTLESVREAAAAGAGTICFEPFICRGQKICVTAPPESLQSRILAALEICREHGADLVWKFPRIAHDEDLDMLIPEIGIAQESGLAGCMTGNPGIAYAIHAAAPGMTILGAAGLNIFNHAAVHMSDPSYSLCTLSPELSRDEIRELVHALPKGGGPRCAVVVQGNIETMITEDCLARLAHPCGKRTGESRNTTGPSSFWLQDGNGRTYPVTMDGACRTHIGSASPISLADHLPELADMGITDVIIDARHRGPASTRSLVRAYREISEMPGSTGEPTADRSRTRVGRDRQSIDRGSTSAGHFLKGLRD